MSDSDKQMKERIINTQLTFRGHNNVLVAVMVESTYVPLQSDPILIRELDVNIFVKASRASTWTYSESPDAKNAVWKL